MKLNVRPVEGIKKVIQGLTGTIILGMRNSYVAVHVWVEENIFDELW